MTRPMPGPPEYVETGSLGDWDSEGRWCNNWDLYWADGRVQYGVWERPDKRLTDAEVAAEFWSATARAQFFAWAPNHLLGIDTPADGQPHKATRPDPYPHWDEAETWRRFATHPHAFKENP